MGAFLPKPITTTKGEKGEGNGIKWSVCSMQGWRVDMEDAHINKTGVSDKLKNWSIFAVFDGHAGKFVAEESAKEFTKHLIQSTPFDTLSDDSNYKEEQIKQGIKDAFRSWDKILRTKANNPNRTDRSGSTATGVLITPEDMFFFNAGDSRTFLVSNNDVKFSTVDHKPTDEAEKKRIESAGGRVMIQRINGSLAVSRALGDFEYKSSSELQDIEQLVSPLPNVTCIKRNSSCDNYIICACDGIYDVMTNDEIKEFISNRLSSTTDQSLVPGSLLDLCLNKGSRDNMSAIIIGLDAQIKPDNTKIDSESVLEDQIVKHVKDHTSQRVNEPSGNFDGLIAELGVQPFLKNHVIGGVPGVLAKRSFIQKAYNEAVSKPIQQ